MVFYLLKIELKTKIISENWAPINFDFLIDSILLRTTLLEFTEIYKLSLENVLKIECIVQTPAPKSEHDLKDTEWVADIKILDHDWSVKLKDFKNISDIFKRLLRELWRSIQHLGWLFKEI
jgi:hypothetical protein